jgi:hypothetical protein
MRFLAISCLLVFAACPGSKEDVPCLDDSNCDLTTGGKCLIAESGRQWCAYPDSNCQSGLRFSEEGVGDDLGGTCTAGGGTKYTLTVNKGGSGEGGVTPNRGILTCTGNTCTAEFDAGAVVELSATPTMGQFLGWSSACSGNTSCAVTMDRDQAVGALFGVPGAALWARQLGSTGRDQGHSIVVDGADAIITVGEFGGTMMVGTTLLESAGGTDIYVVKVASTTGDVLWAKRFGGANNDVAMDVAVDAGNNIYSTGRFLGSVDFGGGPIQSGNQDDVFVLKLAADGTYGWARKIGGNGYDVGQGIAVRGSAVAVTGFFNGTMTVDTTTFTSMGQGDIFVISLAASAGTTTWVKQFGAGLVDVGTDIAIDGSDNVVLTGFYAGTVNFGGGAMSTPSDSVDVLLLKLAAATGAHLSSQHFGGSSNDYGYAITIDAANNIYVGGDFAAMASFGCAASLSASQANLTDAFLVKYTQGFSCTWAKGFGGTGTFDRRARSVTVNAAGSVAVTGSFCGSATFGGSMLTAAGSCPNQDMYAARFAPDGSHLNSARAGGTGSEYSAGVAQSSDGRFYVTGAFEGAAEFGGSLFTSAGADDSFIVGLEAL